jgi:tetratricopeptide (TPR) repeat protein
MKSLLQVVMLFFLVVIVCPSGVGAEETGEYIHYRLGMKYKAEKQYDKAIDEFRKVLAEYPDNYNVYLHIAEIHALQGQPRLAASNLKQALSYNPSFSKAHLLLAESYERDAQISKAIEEYQQYQQSCDPAIRDSVQKVIDRLIARVGVGAVLRGFDSTTGTKLPAVKSPPVPTTLHTAPVLTTNPKVAELFKLAQESFRMHHLDTALRQLKEVIALQPGFTGAYYYAGLIRYQMGQYKLAKINFARGRDYPDPAFTSLLYLGKMYGGEKNYSAAIRELSRYCTVSPSETGKKEAKQLLITYRTLVGTGSVKPDSLAVKNEESDTAADHPALEVRIDSLLSMVTVDTLSDAGQKLLGGIREFQAGNFDKAIREFKKTLAAYPAGAAAVHCMYNTGICYFKLRLLKDAENQFQQVLDRYPRHVLAPQALFLKALSYSERKETSVAEGLYREFLQANRQHPWRGKAWEKLGDAYIDLEQPKKAIDAYVQAVGSSKTSADQVCAFYKIGDAYLTIGNSARACASFDSAITKGERTGVSGRVPDSYYRIADEKYKGKEYQGALEYYTKVTRKFPAFQETPWGIFQIGNVQKNLKKYQDAIDTYKSLIQRFPDDYWAKQAQWKLDDAVWDHEYEATLH